MDIEEIYECTEIVENLNEHVLEVLGDETPCRFEFTYSMGICMICYNFGTGSGSIVLWDSENDPREYDEVEDDLEDLEEYCKKVFNMYAVDMRRLKFLVK